ncbi:terminase small subunit [Bergeriella denitrificans]|uniref:Uncharacterized protein n=1 Tax=Bergeriella denitrificans TaxID=494 RepID=A0A378UHS2_BERDE|nr:terminase small subunit [Bergeriella denitrificans]STZ76845.1 Uncharacterised protein [Bergeriella denitrificans]
MARPRELTAELIREAWEYAQGGYIDKGETVPTTSGLALHLGKSKSTLYQWQSDNPEFADIMEAVQTRQEVTLVNGGLNGDLNPAITKLMLANHGYSDKQQLEVNKVEPFEEWLHKRTAEIEAEQEQ